MTSPIQAIARVEVDRLPEQWRCFHCDEVFQDEAEARLHFGRSERQSPACQIDIAEYRAMEQRMVSYNDEDSDMHRQLHRMANDHTQALVRAEEKGYARGLADGGPYAAEREATLAAERAEVVRLSAECEKLRAIGDEYQAWIMYHAAGHDFDDFLSKINRAALATPTQGGRQL